MDSYKRGNENLRNPKKESHVLPSGEHFVLTSLLKPWYMHFGKKNSNLYTTIIAELYAVFIPSELQHDNLHTCTLERYLPHINQRHTNTTPPHVCKNTKKSVVVPKRCLHTDDHRLLLPWPWITNHSLLPSNFSYCITLTVIKIVFTCGLLLLYLWE